MLVYRVFGQPGEETYCICKKFYEINSLNSFHCPVSFCHEYTVDYFNLFHPFFSCSSAGSNKVPETSSQAVHKLEPRKKSEFRDQATPPKICLVVSLYCLWNPLVKFYPSAISFFGCCSWFQFQDQATPPKICLVVSFYSLCLAQLSSCHYLHSSPFGACPFHLVVLPFLGG